MPKKPSVIIRPIKLMFSEINPKTKAAPVKMKENFLLSNSHRLNTAKSRVEYAKNSISIMLLQYSLLLLQ